MADYGMLKKDVLTVLKCGEVVQREDICELVGASDGAVRVAVRDLRREGYPIRSAGENGGKGYFIDDTEAGRHAIAEDLRNRAYSLLYTAAMLDKAPLKGQVSVND